MKRSKCAALFTAALFIAGGASPGQSTTIAGNSLALRSDNSNVLSQNGYVGTYITLAAPGTVSFSVNAQSASGLGATPRMSLAVDDSVAGWDVGTTSSDYAASFFLPAGTHFVRTQLSNYAGRSLTVNSLGIGGASVSNSSTDALALAAANTYIDNFRKGNVTISVTGPSHIPLLPGTPVQAKMVRNAFNFGGTMSGVFLNDSRDMSQPNPAVGSEAYKFQQFINANFNTIVPSNAGKWASNEITQGNVNMSLVDRQLAYAQSHNMRARMHNLIWGSGTISGNQQPGWVNSLISSAAGGNATAKAQLSTAISNRIAYYAGTSGNRSQKYIEVDGLNESLHNPSYWNIYGASGVANIYNQLAGAISSAGSSAKVYLNEWNVLQFSPAAISSGGVQTGSDPYANWYRQNVDDVRNAGGAVGGIGVQYYASVTQTGAQVHSAATIQKALQNLSVEGLPISMAEFGLAGGTSKANSQALGPQVLDDTMRMFYGNPQATTFMVWGWWDISGAAYPPAAFLDNSQGNNVVTPLGQRWQQLLSLWSTNVTASVDASGNINFTGYWGDYNIGGQSGFSNLTLTKGTNSYILSLGAPPTWHFWNVGSSGNLSSLGSLGSGDTAYFGNASSPRTVIVDAPTTLGMIAFDSPNPYTIGGTSTLTLQGLAGVSAIYVANGSHSIAAPIVLDSDLNITVTPATGELELDTSIDAPTHTITKSGDGSVQLRQLNAAALGVNAGKIVIAPGAGSASVGSVSIAAGARLDLTDNNLNIASGSLQTIRQHLQAGDLFSSLAVNGKALGYAAGGSGLMLVKLTFAGDANLDGQVDVTDLGALATNWQSSSAVWKDGDFNYDGVVDVSDLGALATNWQSGVSGAAGFPIGALGISISVPEPGTALLAAALYLARRSGRNKMPILPV